MSAITPSTDKWFSVYVPRRTDTANAYESYFRLGTPDIAAESARLVELQAAYTDALAQPAVEAAFGGNPTSGVAFYTEGDLVQFVNGKVDTRVLNDSFTVHVLNKADADHAGQDPTKPVTTYRTYLRLGKPNKIIETQIKSAVPSVALLLAYALALAPTPASTISPATKQEKSEAVLTGDIGARTALRASAESGDAVALQALDDLRASADPRASVEHDGKTASAWALAALRELHDKFANALRDKALFGETAARDKLKARAIAGDPVARRKLIELAESKVAAAATGYNGQAAANEWARAALAAVPGGPDMLAAFSLGDGVALYSDRPITLTTPVALKITVGSESRTVLGPTYSEAYDVSDEVIQQIKDGVITQPGKIAQKRLITASLTARELSRASWRTTKFDQAKALSYTLNDSGSFGISSSYAFAFGLKLSNGISGSFDGSIGVGVSVPSALKVELGKKRIETSWTGGKISYSTDQDLKGKSVKLSVGSTEDVAVAPAREALVLALRVGMIAVNALVLVYTATGVGIGNSTSGEGEESTKNMREFLVAGEPVYIAISTLNAIFMAAGLIVSAIQILSKSTVGAAQAVSPAQLPNLVLNSTGIKLQCGASYIHIDPSGIALYGPQIYLASPMTQVLPTYLTGNLSPAGIAEAVDQAEHIAALMALPTDL
jgi:hypothetical protein